MIESNGSIHDYNFNKGRITGREIADDIIELMPEECSVRINTEPFADGLYAGMRDRFMEYRSERQSGKKDSMSVSAQRKERA